MSRDTEIINLDIDVVTATPTFLCQDDGTKTIVVLIASWQYIYLLRSSQAPRAMTVKAL